MGMNRLKCLPSTYSPLPAVDISLRRRPPPHRNTCSFYDFKSFKRIGHSTSDLIEINECNLDIQAAEHPSLESIIQIHHRPRRHHHHHHHRHRQKWDSTHRLKNRATIFMTSPITCNYIMGDIKTKTNKDNSSNKLEQKLKERGSGTNKQGKRSWWMDGWMIDVDERKSNGWMTWWIEGEHGEWKGAKIVNIILQWSMCSTVNAHPMTTMTTTMRVAFMMMMMMVVVVTMVVVVVVTMMEDDVGR